VGLSRSALAGRFHAAVREPPLADLRTMRVQRAMRHLVETSDGLEAVAQAAGYGDAFSFSKAFRRVAGLSPGEFRRQDQADRQQPWRFGAESSVGGPL
jgi:transcriptional regulator GlxA family with amidase domain